VSLIGAVRSAARFAGRRALVTGSSRGIGRACALRLACGGAAVAVHGRTDGDALRQAAEELRRTGATVSVVTGELSDALTAVRLIDDTAESLGGLDILVNNAGIVLPKSASELDPATWQKVLDVNLTSAFFCAQGAAVHMRRGGWGRIINISSQAAEVAVEGYAHYGASKAGLNAITRQLAAEWAVDGITVNAVAPAFINTDLAQEVLAQRPELYDDQLAKVPKRRMGRVEEVAAAVAYLASEDADFTTGEILHVDGGYLAL
jgi:NAD(P)-dependent dehydrogenase (short-subunit alcohol dehydrogenase family)